MPKRERCMKALSSHCHSSSLWRWVVLYNSLVRCPADKKADHAGNPSSYITMERGPLISTHTVCYSTSAVIIMIIIILKSIRIFLWKEQIVILGLIVIFFTTVSTFYSGYLKIRLLSKIYSKFIGAIYLIADLINQMSWRTTGYPFTGGGEVISTQKVLTAAPQPPSHLYCLFPFLYF